jgi:hypothetical protein
VSLARRVDALARRLPDEDPRRAQARARIAALAGECGCTLGGVFLAVAAVLAVAYFAAGGRVAAGPVLLALGLVLAASLLGKLVGLGVARLRLLALRRSLSRRIASPEVRHVHLH